MEVKVKTVEPILVAALRHVGPYPSCGSVFGRLYELLGAANLRFPDAHPHTEFSMTILT